MHAFYFLKQITVQSWFLYAKLEYFTKEKVTHITNKFKNLTNFQIINKTQLSQLHKICNFNVACWTLCPLAYINV
jgi:hypothetical protein